MNNPTFVLLISGAFGGLIRGLAGFLKYQMSYKDVSFKTSYFIYTILMSSFVGLTVTWAIVESDLTIPALENINPAIALIVGYAGGDLLENLYKILVGKTTLYPKPVEKK